MIPDEADAPGARVPEPRGAPPPTPAAIRNDDRAQARYSQLRQSVPDRLGDPRILAGARRGIRFLPEL
jgi:hypothetical protein